MTVGGPLARPRVLAVAVLIAAVLAAAPTAAFELQGHRGARGLLPENTLPAFAAALSLGVTALELDLGVTRDGVVVVSHNQRLNPDLTRDEKGRWLVSEGPAINALGLAELRAFDVGRLNPWRRYGRRFPDQRPVDGTRMPTLREVFALARKAGNDRVRFSIEIKSRPDRPDETLPPAAFADAVLAVVRNEGMDRRTSIQSFDWRSLDRVRAVAPRIRRVYLSAQRRWLDNIRMGEPGPSPWTAGLDVDAFGGSVPRMVAAAGGKVWSVYHRDLDDEALDEAHALGLEVLVWTVNDAGDMRRLIDLGVDGIITDYPDRLRDVMAGKGMSLPRPTPVTP